MCAARPRSCPSSCDPSVRACAPAWQGELSRHAQVCSNDAGAFLLLSKSMLVLADGAGRAITYGSFFFDANGELDLGKPASKQAPSLCTRHFHFN